MARYLDTLELHAVMSWKGQVTGQEAGARGQETGDRGQVSTPTLRASHSWRTRSVWYSAAAAIALAVTAWFVFISEPGTLTPELSATRSVAMLSDLSENAVFAAPGSDPVPPQLGSDLPPGPIRLTAGRAQLMFASTAVVDLTGPCEFVMTGPNQGRLVSGRLEAFVPERAHGFTIATTHLRVVDLGTQFTMNIDEQANEQVSVLRGRVRLERIDSKGLVAEAHELHTAQVARWSSTQQQLTFRLDLLDIIAGGDGTRSQRHRGIDPTTGASGMTQTPNPPTRLGDGRYHRVDDLPMVDGVFVPDNARGPIQVNSRGDRFDGFGDTGGQCFDLIWSGIPPDKRASPGSLSGVDYRARGDQQMWAHANKAITFDLHAMAVHHKAPPRRLTAEVHYLTPPANIPTQVRVNGKLTADVWVLVDGDVRFVRRGFDQSDGAIPIDLPLTRDDHMLTLAVTSGADGVEYDWVVIDEPIVHLQRVHETSNEP
jgi:hypothetical protein